MDYKIACIRCGYRLPITFMYGPEMREILEAAGWRVLSIRQGRGVCPRCQKEE